MLILHHGASKKIIQKTLKKKNINDFIFLCVYIFLYYAEICFLLFFKNILNEMFTFSGTNCEIDLAVCNSTGELLCKNGGECIEGPGVSFACNCSPGN